MKRVIELLKIELFSLGYFFFYIMPGYYLANKFRAFYLKFFLQKVGKNFLVNREVTIESPHKIILGDNVGINMGCWISGTGTLMIGNNVLIGPNVTIITANHNYSEKGKPIKEQGHTLKSVNINNNVWIGAGTIILPGVTIGENCIVGAGSIVSKSLGPNASYAGNPAKKIKDLC